MLLFWQQTTQRHNQYIHNQYVDYSSGQDVQVQSKLTSFSVSFTSWGYTSWKTSGTSSSSSPDMSASHTNVILMNLNSSFIPTSIWLTEQMIHLIQKCWLAGYMPNSTLFQTNPCDGWISQNLRQHFRIVSFSNGVWYKCHQGDEELQFC